MIGTFIETVATVPDAVLAIGQVVGSALALLMAGIALAMFIVSKSGGQ